MARICNDAWRAKARFHVSKLMSHNTRSQRRIADGCGQASIEGLSESANHAVPPRDCGRDCLVLSNPGFSSRSLGASTDHATWPLGLLSKVRRLANSEARIASLRRHAGGRIQVRVTTANGCSFPLGQGNGTEPRGGGQRRRTDTGRSRHFNHLVVTRQASFQIVTSTFRRFG
jgi:hypothetical protein